MSAPQWREEETWEWPPHLPVVRVRIRYNRYWVENLISPGRWGVHDYLTLTRAVNRFREVVHDHSG